MEYLFSLHLQLSYSTSLPSKSCLSSKSNFVEIATLSQKYIMQILQITLTAPSLRNQWILVLINLVPSSVRDIYYFCLLPIYNLKALLWQAKLIVIISSLVLAQLIQTILKSMDQVSDADLILYMWIILALLSTKLSANFIQRKITNLIAHPNHISAELLVHRVSLSSRSIRYGDMPTKIITNMNGLI